MQNLVNQRTIQIDHSQAQYQDTIENVEGNQINENFLSQEVSRQIKFHFPQFQKQYQQSLPKLNLQSRQKIKKWTWNREKQNYLYFVKPEQFVEFSKKQRLQHFQQNNTKLVTNYLLKAMRFRQDKVQDELKNSIIQIQTTIKPKTIDISNSLPNQQNPLKGKQQKSLQQQQIRRRYKQILSSYKKEKERLQKIKLKQIQQKKQKQSLQRQYQLKKQQQIKKQHSELINLKISKSVEKRNQQIQQRKQRNSDYNYIIKSWAKNQILHEKMQREFRKRYQSQIEQDRKKHQTQRIKLSLNSRVEDLKLKEHEQKYLKWRSQNQAARASKLQQQERMIQLYEEQLKKFKIAKRKNLKSDPEDQQGEIQQDDEDNQKSTLKYGKGQQYATMKQEKRKVALEKRKKMQTYWQSFVKQQYQPTIDKKKQLQIQNLIQSLQRGRKMKKVKNEKGQWIYQQLKLSDPTLKGMQYLQHSRQIGRLRKSIKRQDSMDQKSSIHQEMMNKKKSIDYLSKMRQSRSSSLNSSHIKFRNKLAFLEKRDVSFNDKLQRVELQTFKLQQMTKLSQNQLKYGKFKTSEEILQYKQDIDNNHIEILKMKLKLAEVGKK